MALVKWSETQPSGASNNNWYVSAISDDGGCILAGAGGLSASGYLYYSSDGGSSWGTTDPYNDAVARGWFWASMSSDGTKMLVTAYNGRLWYTSNSGSSWSEVRPAGDKNYNYSYCALSNDGTKLYISETGGNLWYSGNSGSSWSNVHSAGRMAASGDGSRVIVGGYGSRCYYSSNYGTDWDEVQPKGNTTGTWQGFAMSDDGATIVAIEIGGGSYISYNSGADWSAVEPAGAGNKNWHGCAISSDGSDIMLQIYGGGYVYRSFDSGSTWCQIRPGKTAASDWRYCCAISADASKWMTGVLGGRLYLGDYSSATTFYVNTGSTAGGTGITNAATGDDRAYASLGEATDQLAYCGSDENLEILCCGSVQDSSTVDLLSYTETGVSFTVRGNPAVSNGANNSGVYDASKYTKIQDVTYGEGIRVSDVLSQVTVLSLQIYATANMTPFHIDVGSVCNVTVDKSILVIPSGRTSNDTAVAWNQALSVLKITNSVLAFGGTPPLSGAGVVGGCTMYNSLVRGFVKGFNIGTYTVKNSIVFDNTTDFAGGTVDHCASDDGNGTNPVSISNWDDEFYNPNYTVDFDYRMSLGSHLRDAGVGPSVDSDVPTDDIVGDTRSGATASVGPFENQYPIPPNTIWFGADF